MLFVTTLNPVFFLQGRACIVPLLKDIITPRYEKTAKTASPTFILKIKTGKVAFLMASFPMNREKIRAIDVKLVANRLFQRIFYSQVSFFTTSLSPTSPQTSHEIAGSTVWSINFHLPVKIESIFPFLQKAHTQISGLILFEFVQYYLPNNTVYYPLFRSMSTAPFQLLHENQKWKIVPSVQTAMDIVSCMQCKSLMMGLTMICTDISVVANRPPLFVVLTSAEVFGFMI